MSDTDCFDTCGTCPVRGKSLFAGLSKKEISLLAEEKSRRAYRKGEVVFRQGFEASGIFCVGAGSVKVVQKAKGKSIFVRIAGAGDSAGHRSVFTSTTFRGEARAAEGTHLCFVPKSSLLRLLAKSTGFSLRLVKRMARDLELTESMQRAQREKTVKERAAILLLSLLKIHGEKESDGSLSLRAPVSRADLATMLGVANESLLRTLSDFRKAGWLAHGSRLRVLNPGALAKLAGRRYP